jgi:hypothetical protein
MGDAVADAGFVCAAGVRAPATPDDARTCVADGSEEPPQAAINVIAATAASGDAKVLPITP